MDWEAAEKGKREEHQQVCSDRWKSAALYGVCGDQRLRTVAVTWTMNSRTLVGRLLAAIG